MTILTRPEQNQTTNLHRLESERKLDAITVYEVNFLSSPYLEWYIIIKTTDTILTNSVNPDS